MSIPPDVIIIRGAPGVGKTELSKALARYYPQGSRVEVDALRKMVISVNWTDQAEHIKLLGLAARTVADFVEAGFSPVIVVDTFSGDKVAGFLARLEVLRPGISYRIFALHASADVLASRLASRPEGQFKDLGITLKLNGDVLKVSHREEVRIDASHDLPEALVYRLKDNL
jgi:broad-specificity NMP kinase